MRRILLITLIILSTISCKKDDGLNNTIIGSWQIIEMYDSSHGMISLDDCDKQSTFEFIANNKVIIEWFYEFGGDCLSEDEDIINYSINENTITFVDTEEDDTDLAEIVELTETRLKLKYDYEEDGEAQFNTLTFKRL